MIAKSSVWGKNENQDAVLWTAWELRLKKTHVGRNVALLLFCSIFSESRVRRFSCY